jgi:hypothetical protein
VERIKVRVSTPQPEGRWRIGQQWFPAPREALVTPEELERLQADPLLQVTVLEQTEPGLHEPEGRPAKRKR